MERRHNSTYFKNKTDKYDNLNKLFYSYKSRGSDQIPTEVIHAEGEIVRSKIHKVINSIWNKEKLPDQWKESIILPVHKKSDYKTDCGNFRGI
jgi:hypothetical protein